MADLFKCSCCKVEKPREDFYTSKKRNGEPTRNKQCKACLSAKDCRASTRYSRARSKAIQANIPFTITPEHYAELVARPCYYCGGELPKKGTSLDRLTPKRGYVPDNVQPACWVCNYTKSDIFYPDEMQEIGALIAHFRVERVAKGRDPIVVTYNIPWRKVREMKAKGEWKKVTE